MKICVTGGTGFIGRQLVIALIAQGHTVIVPTRDKDAVNSSSRGIHYIHCNLIDPDEDLRRCVDGCDVILNCAGEINEKKSMMELHVHATHRLLKTFINYLNSNRRVGHWVQLSSVGAYGPATPSNKIRIVTEDTELAPIGDYEITKTKADELIVATARQTPCLFTYSILRPSNVWGSSMPNSALRAWALAIKRGRFFFIGPKDAISTYIHVRDVVDALIACAFNGNAVNQIFNISNDCYQVELVSAMAKVLGVKEPNARLPEWMARFMSLLMSRIKGFPLTQSRVNALVSRTHYSSEKIRLILGVVPKINLNTSIKDVIAT